MTPSGAKCLAVVDAEGAAYVTVGERPVPDERVEQADAAGELGVGRHGRSPGAAFRAWSVGTVGP